MKNKTILNKISTVDELLLELKDLYENGKMTVEEQASYENFIYNISDRVLDM